jgi:cell division protein FtsN
MAGPVRKPRVRAAGGAPEKERRFALRLSLPVAGLLAAVLVVAVGWSFFMGYMVGRGQNPEQRVEQLTGLGGAPAAPAASAAQPNAPRKDKALADKTPAPEAAAPDPAVAGPPPPAAQSAAGSAPGDGKKADSATAAKSKGQPPAPQPQGPQSQGPQPQGPQPQGKNAYPFARPSGGGLAAWGIKPEQEAPLQAAGPEQPAGQPEGQARTKATQTAQPRAQAAQPLYDFVFQTAAFNNADDADKLRSRLEGQGLRTRLQKKGSLHLVLVNLRGTDLDAANLREELQRMRLGAPLLKSKKAVAGKSRKTGR